MPLLANHDTRSMYDVTMVTGRAINKCERYFIKPCWYVWGEYTLLDMGSMTILCTNNSSC